MLEYFSQILKRRTRVIIGLDIVLIELYIIGKILNENIQNSYLVLIIFICFIILMIELFIGYTTYLYAFFRAKKTGFIMYCSTINRGIERFLSILVLICEINIIKSCILVLLIYDSLSDIVTSSCVIVENQLSCWDMVWMIFVYFNIYGIISMHILATVKDSSFSGLLSNVITMIVSIAVFEYIKNINAIYVRILISFALVAVCYICCKWQSEIMKRRYTIGKEI